MQGRQGYLLYQWLDQWLWLSGLISSFSSVDSSVISTINWWKQILVSGVENKDAFLLFLSSSPLLVWVFYLNNNAVKDYFFTKNNPAIRIMYIGQTFHSWRVGQWGFAFHSPLNLWPGVQTCLANYTPNFIPQSSKSTSRSSCHCHKPYLSCATKCSYLVSLPFPHSTVLQTEQLQFHLYYCLKIFLSNVKHGCLLLPQSRGEGIILSEIWGCGCSLGNNSITSSSVGWKIMELEIWERVCVPKSKTVFILF